MQADQQTSTEPTPRTKSSWIVPVLSFTVPFLIGGALGFVFEAMDSRGFEQPNYSACCFYFFLFGLICGVLGLLVCKAAPAFINWWKQR